MASSSGTSSGSPQIPSSGAKDTQRLMEQRKRKRMQSNRESARRSRLRKQKHLDDLMAEVSRVSKENNEILTSINVTTQQYVNLEAENSVLRARMTELTQRLQSLGEILNIIESSGGGGSCMFEADEFQNQGFADGFLNNPWNSVGVNHQQPIIASAEVLDYYYY